MNCYYQGCTARGTTKEHIPPKSFFPADERHQLLTVKSCPTHNNQKSEDDFYALAQICMNASPSNRAREIWLSAVAPQFEKDGGKLRSMLAKGSVPHGGGVAYRVDQRRLDGFFTALSCGLVFKSQGAPLPAEYEIGHAYHSLISRGDPVTATFERAMGEFYESFPNQLLEFGTPALHNERIYKARVIGAPGFEGHITITHLFFGTFKVTSMLSKPE